MKRREGHLRGSAHWAKAASTFHGAGGRGEEKLGYWAQNLRLVAWEVLPGLAWMGSKSVLAFLSLLLPAQETAEAVDGKALPKGFQTDGSIKPQNTSGSQAL